MKSPTPALVDRSCPNCHSSSYEKIFDQPTLHIVGISEVGYHHQIQICRDCGMVFASPLMPESEIQKYYETMSNYDHPLSSGIQITLEQRQVDRYVELLVERFPPDFRGKALDIGCATAIALSRLKGRGWQVLGVDPSPRCREIAQKNYGIRVVPGFFDMDTLKDEGPFDLVIMSHVLEHLLHPGAVIADVAKLLSDDGLLYIEVPDLMKPWAPKCYFAFEHINYFTSRSLLNSLQHWGFKNDHLATYENGPAIHPFYPVIASTWKKRGPTEQMPKPVNDCSPARQVIAEFSVSARRLLASVEEKIRKAVSQTPPGKLALWGAGIHTSQILSETSLRPSELACIFDNDPKKAGKMIDGVAVEVLGADYRALKQRVAGILISSEASEEAIYEQIKFLETHGIRIFRLYSDS